LVGGQIHGDVVTPRLQYDVGRIDRPPAIILISALPREIVAGLLKPRTARRRVTSRLIAVRRRHHVVELRVAARDDLPAHADRSLAAEKRRHSLNIVHRGTDVGAGTSAGDGLREVELETTASSR